MMDWSSHDGNLNMGFGIDWRSWGIGSTVTIYGDINNYHMKFGPLHLYIVYWRIKDWELKNDIQHQG